MLAMTLAKEVCMRNSKLPEPLNGKWIWGPSASGGSSPHILFRKDFTLFETAGIAELWIASPAHFQIFINGRFLAHGPVYHPANAVYASRYDITHLLQVGVNFIAVHGWYDGVACAAHKPDAPLLWLQVFCDNKSVAATDNTWSCLATDCFIPSGLRASASCPDVETVDFRKIPYRWQTTPCNYLLKPSPTIGETTQAFFWMPPKTILPLEDGPSLEAETSIHTSWETNQQGTPVAIGTYKQKNDVFTLSFADCIKDKSPNGLYAAETFLYSTSSAPQSALCICNEPYKLFINNELIKQQAAPSPAARNVSNTTLGRTLHPDELVPCNMTVQLKNGWNRILILQHCTHATSCMTIIWAELPDNTLPLHRKPDFTSPHGWNLAGPLNAPFALINPAFPLENLPKTPFLIEDSRSNDIAAFYLACEFKTQQSTSLTSFTPLLHSSETYLIDFGKTIYGIPEITVAGEDGDIVDIIIGNHRFHNDIISLEDGCRRNVATAILRNSLEPITWLLASPAGFRYLMVIARKAKTNITIRNVTVRTSIRDVSTDSHFSCSDETLNAIWKLGQNTLEITNQNIFMDSPTKDQAQCIPDAMIQSWSAYYVQGAYDSAAIALTTFAKAQIETGEFNAIAPSGFFQAVPDYSLAWPVWLQRHFMHTGDIHFLKTLIPALNSLMAYYNQVAVSPDGPIGSLMHLTGIQCFLDYDPNIDRDGISTGLNGIYCRALLAASWLTEQAGLQDIAQTYKKRAATIASQIRKLCWNPEKGLFADSFHDGCRSNRHSPQSNVLAIYGSIPSHDWIDGIWKKLFLEDAPYERFVSKEFDNPYFKYFILEDAFALGKSEWGLNFIDRYWGGMEKAGATSAWELFSPDAPELNNRIISICQGYGASPNAFLISELIGIRPAEPGMKMIYFNPLPGKVTWAKASVPTPNGTISVNWSLRPDGVFDASLSATFPLEVIPLLNPDIAESALFKVSDNVSILAPE